MAASLPFIFLFILLSNSKTSAQTHTNISSGTPLTAPSSILSPSGDFAFGFRPLETDPNLFLLAVWFQKLSNKTVVWTANGDAPVASGSIVGLTPDGEFSLKDPTGQEIWNASVSNVSSAAVLDDGNFMLLSADAEIIWQTFENPTDTILPGQVLQEGSRVYARLMDDDYSRGRFELVLQSDGNLVLYPIGYPAAVEYDSYWFSGTSGKGVQLVFNESGNIYLSFQNNSEYFNILTETVSTDYYQKATLDPDGIFRQYSFLKNELSTGTWEVIARIDVDICNKMFTKLGSGVCGFNSYCTTDANGRVDCECPFHYSFIDPTRKYKGCAPDFAPQSCEPGGASQFDFYPMPNVNWPLGDADHLQPMTEVECRANCLNDCFCAVAIYNDADNGSCWKKKFPLSNGRADDIGKALIKYSSQTSSANKKRDWTKWILAGCVVLGSAVVLNLVLVSVCLYRRIQLKTPLVSCDIKGVALCSFSYKELKQATKGFGEEIGRGAFSIVYKGILASQGRTVIAVKKLERLSEQAEKDFVNEVATIGQTHHRNLVQLIGFCREGMHRLLVFEFMSNGSLAHYLYSGDWPEWSQRVQIAGGLAYLHEECRTQIVHCDIKPQNILLDENYVARISDFGLAKLLGLEQTRTTTGIRGTIGYFAPEWFKNIAVTTKVDVYSFGVVLLEIVCCRRNFDLGVESSEKVTLIDYAIECYRNGRLDLLVREDEDAMKNTIMLERFVMVAISCVQDDPWLRPSLKKVVQMLEGSVSVSMPANMYSVCL